MKKAVSEFVSVYLLFVGIFVLQRPLFMGWYHQLYANVAWSDWFRVMVHGLPLDCSIAAYLSVIPGLLLILSVWNPHRWVFLLRNIYLGVVCVLMATVFVSDLVLYGYWGFRLDSTSLFYLFSSPKEAFASASLWLIVGGVIVVLVYAAAIYLLFYVVLSLFDKRRLCDPATHRMGVSGVLFVLILLLFIPIRGGFGVSTMNVGKVYFSTNQRLNHAAINPCFSLIDSLMREDDFDSQYRFYSPEKANQLFAALTDRPVQDSLPRLLNDSVTHPNVILIVLESFSTQLMPCLGGQPVALCLDSIARQGVLFTNFYANSFRTDRGLVSILSGYPAQPTTSIMKYPHKTQSLPSIPASLKKSGYRLHYYYGGDADFTNMRSYLLSMGMDQVVSEDDFPLSERLGKWGAHDDVVFHRLENDLDSGMFRQPFFVALQTSSSHEPYDVPYHKLSNPILNAFAYADSCVGSFVRNLKRTPLWKNSVVVLVPDHRGGYQQDVEMIGAEDYHIPLIITGGAIREPRRIDTYGSQIDLAATLLPQLGIAYQDFGFSKNMLNPASPHFAFFAFPNLFGVLSPEGEAVFDCESGRVLSQRGAAAPVRLEQGKAYLQKLYDDLAKR